VLCFGPYVKRFVVVAALSLCFVVSLRAQTSVPQLLTRQLRAKFDSAHGGFAAAPKVVQPQAIQFLLRQAARGDRDAREMSLTTLREMARGAVHDQVGGGFHHETSDAAWRAPQFEKLLSDQAMLAIAYTEAWQLTDDAEYRRVAQRTLDYVLRDLALKGGGFASEQGRESLIADRGPRMAVGRFYGWELPELRRLLGRDFDLIAYYFGFKDGGNVPESLDPHGYLRGLNLPFIEHSDTETRARFNVSQQQLTSAVDTALARMQLVRSHRPQPNRASGISVSANALMISALARAGEAFDEPRYSYSAVYSARFLESTIYDRKTHRLRGSSGQEQADVREYACVVQGMFDVYEATFDPHWLQFAIELQQRQDELFWDGELLRYRAVARADDGMADGNSVSAMNLLRLAAVTASSMWQTRAEAIFRSSAATVESNPESMPLLVDALAASERPRLTVVIDGDVDVDPAKSLLRAARHSFDPLQIVVVRSTKRVADALASFVPALARAQRGDVPAAAFVCRDAECSSAITDPARLSAILGK
jgi:uncharacterized protein